MSGVAIGFFDGVHLGHRAILAGADAALTFAEHPLAVLAPDRAPPLLMDRASREAAIRACGVREVSVLDFGRALADMPAEEFAETVIAAAAGPSRCVRCGADWRFGRGGRGDAALLRRLGFAVAETPFATFGGERISSTRIREALGRGEVEAANAMLGAPFARRGRAERGKGLGRELGFPTVNLRLEPTSRLSPPLALPLGVYAVSARGALGVANYGLAPTLGGRAWPEPVLEVHFLGETPAVSPGETLPVELLRFLRPERRFGSLAELRAQIALDAEAARRGVCARPAEMVEYSHQAKGKENPEWRN